MRERGVQLSEDVINYLDTPTTEIGATSIEYQKAEKLATLKDKFYLRLKEKLKCKTDRSMIKGKLELIDDLYFTGQNGKKLQITAYKGYSWKSIDTPFYKALDMGILTAGSIRFTSELVGTTYKVETAAEQLNREAEFITVENNDISSIISVGRTMTLGDNMETIINSDENGTKTKDRLVESVAKLRKYKGYKARRNEKVKFLDEMEENGQPVNEATCELEAKCLKEANIYCITSVKHAMK